MCANVFNTFTFDVNDSNPPRVQLDRNISNPTVNWETFAADLYRSDPTLVAYRVEALRQRWLDGDAAIALAKNEIVSYTSIIPLWNAEIQSKMEARLEMRSTGIVTEIYEAATGWTRPAWRNRGIYTRLRKTLHQAKCQDKLGLCFCWGVGVSPILWKFNWNLIPWSRYPFVSALIGWFSDELFWKTNATAIKLGDFQPYEGEGDFPDAVPAHDWNQFIHLWSSDVRLVKEVDHQLGAASKDIVAWRAALPSLFPNLT